VSQAWETLPAAVPPHHPHSPATRTRHPTVAPNTSGLILTSKLPLPADWTGTPSVPTGLSPSSLNAYLACSTRWAYDKVVCLPTVTSLPAMVGTHVHRVLEIVMAREPAERTLDAALAVHQAELERCEGYARTLAPAWEPTLPEEIDRAGLTTALGEHADDGHTHRFVFDLLTIVPDCAVLAERGEAGVRAYFEMSKDPSAVQVVAVEAAIQGAWTTPSGVVPVRGIIDRVDRHPDGSLICWDYKSGSSPDPRFDDGSYRRQLLFYAAMSLDHYGELPSIGGLLYLGDRKVDLHRFSLDEVEEFQAWVGTVWADIQQRYTDDLDYRSTIGPLCAWCPHVALCPDGSAEVRRRAANGTGRGGVRADAPARELLALPAL
jgi:putative RecB family exonuclease